MAKVTSKLQVTVPKALADRYRIRPGDELEWIAAGDSIRVIPADKKEPRPDPERRLQLFDEATRRQKRRQRGKARRKTPANRGWKREDLYVRGRAR